MTERIEGNGEGDNAEPIESDALGSARDLQDTTLQMSTVDSTPEIGAAVLVPALNGGKVQIGWPKGKSNPRGLSPTAKLRDAMRQGLADMLPDLIDKIATGKVSMLQGADFLAKYGIGSTGTVTIVSPDVISRLESQASLIASRPQWDTVELLAMLKDVWS